MALYHSAFRPLATDDLVRIGAVYDGGYVLPKRIVSATKGLLSFGLSDEWEFEAEMSRSADIPVVCFDPSVDARFWMKKIAGGVGYGILRADGAKFKRSFRALEYRRFFDGTRHRHIRKAVGYPGPGSVGFADALAEAALPEPIFLKMDIEGWEYRILDDIVPHCQRLTGLAIEFHDVDLHEARIVAFIRAISETQQLVHFHANSHTAIGPKGAALVVELSFMNRNLLRPNEQLVAKPLPLPGLDAPNLPKNREADVSFRQAG